MRRKEDWIPLYRTLECLNGLTEQQKLLVDEEVKRRHPNIDHSLPTQNDVVELYIQVAKDLGFYNC